MKKERQTPVGTPTYSAIIEQLQGSPKTHELKTFITFAKAVQYFLERSDELGYNTQEGDGDEILRTAGGIGHDYRIELIQQNVISIFNNLPPRRSNPIK